MKQREHNEEFAMYMTFGVVAVAAVFVLVIFSKFVIEQAVYETELEYSRNESQDGQNRAFGENDNRSGIPSVPPVLATDPARSFNPDGNYRLTIIEYGDFECPFCAEMADNLSRVLSAFPDVRLVWKDFTNPLIHPESIPASNAARCAQEQGYFWEFHDALFDNQEILGKETYMAIASALGMNLAEFGACLEDNVYNSLVSNSTKEAELYEIPGTPYMFIGDTVIDQLIPYSQLESIVREELDKAKAIGD